MRIEWRTCLVCQPRNHKPLRIFFCRHLFLRRGGSQFTQFYHCRNVIFFHNQPLFSNFQLFRALKTQLTFMAVGEPDYTITCSLKRHKDFIDWAIHFLLNLFPLDRVISKCVCYLIVRAVCPPGFPVNLFFANFCQFAATLSVNFTSTNHCIPNPIGHSMS